MKEIPTRIVFGFPWWIRPFLRRDVVAITLRRSVHLATSLRGVSDETYARVVRHEMVHVEQISRLGFSRFLFRYLSEYVSNRWRGLSAADSYAEISFEKEASALEREGGELPAVPREGRTRM